jgi:hypothetical protein
MFKRLNIMNLVTLNREFRRIWADIEELKGAPAPTSEPVVDEGDAGDIDELREQAKELGIKSWHVMGEDKLKTAIKEHSNNGE